MTIEEHKRRILTTKSGMELAEYNMLRDKALRGEMLIMSDENGNIIEVPAREHFARLYGEEVVAPTNTSAAPAINSVVDFVSPSVPIDNTAVADEKKAK